MFCVLGGFAANREMIAKLQPSLSTLATTNGPWAQGEGLKLGQEVGAQLYGIDKVLLRDSVYRIIISFYLVSICCRRFKSIRLLL